MTGIAILGSTGSIGRQTVEVVRAAPDRYEVRALASGHRDDTFEAQIREFASARVWNPAGSLTRIWRRIDGPRGAWRSWPRPMGSRWWSWPPPG